MMNPEAGNVHFYFPCKSYDLCSINTNIAFLAVAPSLASHRMVVSPERQRIMPTGFGCKRRYTSCPSRVAMWKREGHFLLGAELEPVV